MLKGPEAEVKAVLLDWDDTCVATIEPIWALHKHIALTYYNKHLDDEELQKYWGMPLEKLVQLIYETEDHEEAFINILKHKEDEKFQKWFFEQTPEILKTLSTNRKLGLITAHVNNMLHIEFDYLNLDPRIFNYLQTSDQTDFHKPDPRVFGPTIEWLKLVDIEPHEAIYVGDSLKDYMAATEAGIQFVGVCTGLIDAKVFAEAGAKSIPSLQQLPYYLDN